MKLTTLLEQKKEHILKRWFSLILEAYPPDVAIFLKHEKDRFTNPVGYAISTGTEALLDEVIHGAKSDRIISALDSIIRIRAVQDFTPSQALAVVFLLKKAVREELKIKDSGFTSLDPPELYEELLQFETRIDGLASLAFDVYVKCRDDINRIKVGEANAERTMARQLTRNRLSHTCPPKMVLRRRVAYRLRLLANSPRLLSRIFLLQFCQPVLKGILE